MKRLNLLPAHVISCALVSLTMSLVMSMATPLMAGELEYNLTDAINRGDLNYAAELIKKGADVNQQQEPFAQSAIISAPLSGIKFVQLLVENGADVNAKDQDNTTALINACLYGNLEIARYLISKGADINIINKDDMTVMDAAILSRNQELISYIKLQLNK